jgi:hypothetical protein
MKHGDLAADLVGGPLGLGIVKLGDPRNVLPSLFQAVQPRVSWWLTLHLLQLVLALVGVAAASVPGLP